MRKRGQASLEFSSTYAWSIFVAIIILGALAYVGLLSPSKIIPDRCIFSLGFGCDDFRVIEEAGYLDVQMVVKNELAKEITIRNFTIIEPKNINTLTCTVSGILPKDVKLSEKVTVYCNATGNNLPVAGDKVKLLMYLKYSVAGRPFSHLSDIELVDTIE